MARRAGACGLVARQIFAHGGRIGLLEAALEVGQDALERMRALDDALLLRLAAGLGRVGELDGLLAGAVEQHLARLLGQRLERRVDVEAVVLGHALEHRERVAVAAVPALDRARGQAQRREGDHALRIERDDLAQAVAARAGAHRRVEREQARLQLRQRVAADRAGELGRIEMLGARVHLERERAAVGDAQRGLEALGQALARVVARLQAVDHDVDVVLLGLLEHRQVARLDDLAVDAKAHVALRLHVGEQLGELALAVAHHRREHHQLRFFGQREHGVHHLRHGRGGQRQVVVGAVGRAGAGEQQAQVVVDLGDGADGGARVVAGGLLLDGDRRRQALDHVDVGLVHQLQELARIGRQALHVAALALGVEGVEREAGLARARQPGDHHQRVLGDVEVDVLEVVRARAAHADRMRVRARHADRVRHRRLHARRAHGAGQVASGAFFRLHRGGGPGRGDAGRALRRRDAGLLRYGGGSLGGWHGKRRATDHDKQAVKSLHVWPPAATVQGAAKGAIRPESAVRRGARQIRR